MTDKPDLENMPRGSLLNDFVKVGLDTLNPDMDLADKIYHIAAAWGSRTRLAALEETMGKDFRTRLHGVIDDAFDELGM